MKRLIVVILATLAICRTGLCADSAEDMVVASGIKGGLVVHVGCGDGTLTVALRKNGACVVHGLDTDPANVRKTRERVLAGKHDGMVSAAEFDGAHLPYVDNMVNLIVCSREFNLSRDEILRVLCPGGVALVRDGRVTRKLTKPWPDGYDEWTHYLHGADNNAVSRDSAISAPLKHLQWKGSPMYSRHHDKSSSMPAAVTAGGKVFYIIDEGPRASILWAPKWQLVARDAFNGIVLWRKDIKQWTSHLWRLKSGPSVTPRRLVALGNSVYTTLGLLSPVSKLDAANGEVLHTYAGTERTEEIICKDGVLYLVINPDIDPKQRGGAWKQSARTLMAVRESDGTMPPAP
ncbi:MAG: class I SAM-dependent methyltransferase [Planctomycetota bacterium]